MRSPRATLLQIRLPAALPAFASGARIAAAVAPIGAVIGEWVGASAGLGYLMTLSLARGQTPLAFAALVVLCLLGLALYSRDRLGGAPCSYPGNCARRMTMRILIRLIAALALASIALPAAAQDKVRVLLDWFVNPDHAALVIAKQRGFFTKHGLDVELIAPADPNAPPKLVAAGQAEYAVSYQPTLQMLAAEGLPLVRSACWSPSRSTALVALEDGPVKTIADFKGRKIGYSIAGFEEALLGAILEKAGLTLKDVTLINVNFALTTALMSKQVDGVIGAFRNFELNDLALHKAKGRLWPVEKNGVPTYDELHPGGQARDGRTSRAPRSCSPPSPRQRPGSRPIPTRRGASSRSTARNSTAS